VITEKDWPRILAAFPVAHRIAARAKIEARRRDYLRDRRQKPAEQHKVWKRIAKLLKSASVRELCQLVSRVDLNKLRDPSFLDPLVDHNWLPRMTQYLSRGAKIAAVYADLSHPQEQLYAGLFRTWTEAGRKLSISATGPLVRFVQDVTNDLFPITGDGIKKAVSRELVRRQLKATLIIGKQSTVTFEEAKIRVKRIKRIKSM
jgi:hypothetical protein